jgi:hypothetical protein
MGAGSGGAGRHLLQGQPCSVQGFDLCPFSQSPGAGPNTQCCSSGGALIQGTNRCIPKSLSCICGFQFGG